MNQKLINNMRPIVYFSLFSLLFLSVGCLQKPSAIKGTVFGANAADRQPLAGVVVSLQGTSISTTTSDDGSYTLPYFPGAFKVSYDKPGFVSAVKEFNVQVADLIPAEPVGLYSFDIDSITKLVKKDFVEFSKDLGLGFIVALKDRAKIDNVSCTVTGNGTHATVHCEVAFTMLDSIGGVGGATVDAFRPVFNGIERSKGERFTQQYAFPLVYDTKNKMWMYSGL
jgi:hypothetical protein